MQDSIGCNTGRAESMAAGRVGKGGLLRSALERAFRRTRRSAAVLHTAHDGPALPDLEIEVRQQHVADEAILVEVVIRGTHLGGWKGLPATRRRVKLPLCGIYTFDADDRLAGERIYYDRGTVLRQLGVFHEPVSRVGRICTLATHPFTIARAYARKLFRT